jgi:hypothetical protein
VAIERAAEGDRPRSVGTAVTLLWVSLAVGIAKVALDFAHLRAMAPLGFTLFVLVATFAVLILLVLKIAAGRNWARITFLILFIIGTVPTLPVVRDELERAPLVGGLSILQILLQIWALVLLFTRPGSAWFRKAAPASA